MSRQSLTRRDRARGLSRAALLGTTVVGAHALVCARADTIEISTDGAVVVQTDDVTSNTADAAILISGDGVTLTIDGAAIRSTVFTPTPARSLTPAIQIAGDNAVITVNANASILAEGVGLKMPLFFSPAASTNAAIINYGTIEGRFDDGIEMGNGFHIENYGVIRGGSAVAPGQQVGSRGDGATIFFSDFIPVASIDAGVINHASGQIFGARFGVGVVGALINDGLIEGELAGATVGGVFDLHGRSLARNSGTIRSPSGWGLVIDAISLPETAKHFNLTELTNPNDALALFDRASLDVNTFDLLLENSGSIETGAPFEADRSILLFNEDAGMLEEVFVTATFQAINATSAAGYIFNAPTGVIAATAPVQSADAISLFAVDPIGAFPGAMVVHNQGAVIGNIVGSDAQELLYNEGFIAGSIALGLGDDLVILGPSSELTGSLTLDDGDDILISDTRAIVGGILDGGVGGDDFLMLILGGTTLSTDKIFNFERVQTFGEGPLDNIDLSHVSEISVGGGGALDIGATGFTGDVIVFSGGFVSGTGLIRFMRVSDGGTVSPGNSVGTINVVGDTSFAAGSFYDVEVNATASDQVLAGGTVTVAGGTVTVTGEGGIDIPSGLARPEYVILSGAAGLTGEFDDLVDNLRFYVVRLDYTTTDVLLILDPIGADFANIAQTPNQLSVGGALAAGIPTAQGDFLTVMESFVGLSDGAVRASLDSIAGDLHTAGALGASQITMLAAATARRGVEVGSGETNFWAGGFYNTLSLDGLGGGSADIEAIGALFGVERGLGSDITVGAFGGYVKAAADAADSLLFNPSGYVAGVTLRASAPHAHVGLEGGYVRQNYEVSRTLEIGALRRTANASGGVDGLFLSANASVDAITSGAFTLSPFVEYALSSLEGQSFAEVGAASLGINGKSMNLDRQTVRAGSRLAVDFAAFSASLDGGYQAEIGDRGAALTAELQGVPGSAFAIQGPPLSKHAGFAAFSLHAPLGGIATAQIGYRGDFGSFHSSHGAQVRLDVRF